MSIFAISDLHFSLGCNKPMDVFPGWEGYVEKIKTNWLKTVTNTDTVVIPGDISWGMSMEEALPDFQFIHNLPGKKVILKGNHDYWWSTMTKMNEFLCLHGLSSIHILNNNAYETEHGVICGSRGWINDPSVEHNRKIILREAGRLDASIKSGESLCGGDKELLVFLHYPPVTQNSCCDEIIGVLKKHGITTCYYGHIHGEIAQYAFNGKREGIQFQITSCDALGFMPLKITE